MTTQLPSATTAARRAYATPRPDDGHAALATRHREMLEGARHLMALAIRLEEAGIDPFSRTLAAAVVERFDRLLPDARAHEERRLLPALERQGGPRDAYAAACLRVDLAWLAANWRELRPQVEATALDLTWVDIDSLRDGAELFAALVREHVTHVAAAVELAAWNRRPETGECAAEAH